MKMRRSIIFLWEYLCCGCFKCYVKALDIAGEWRSFYSRVIESGELFEAVRLVFKLLRIKGIQICDYLYNWGKGTPRHEVIVGKTLTYNEFLKVKRFSIQIGIGLLVVLTCWYYYIFVTIESVPLLRYFKLLYVIGKWADKILIRIWGDGVKHYGREDRQKYWNNCYKAILYIIDKFNNWPKMVRAWCWTSMYLLSYIYLIRPTFLRIYFLFLEWCKFKTHSKEIIKFSLMRFTIEFPFKWIREYQSAYTKLYFRFWRIDTFYIIWKENNRKFKSWYLGGKDKTSYGNKCEIYFFDKINFFLGIIWVIWTYIAVLYYVGDTFIYGFCMSFGFVCSITGAIPENFEKTREEYSSNLDDNLYNDFPFLTRMIWSDWFFIKFIIFLVYFFLTIEINIRTVVNTIGLSKTFEEDVLDAKLRDKKGRPVLGVEEELSFENRSKWMLHTYIIFMEWVKGKACLIENYYEECFSKDYFKTLLNFNPASDHHFWRTFLTTVWENREEFYGNFKYITFFVYIFYIYRQRAWRPTGDASFAIYTEFTVLVPNFLFLLIFKYTMWVPLIIVLQFTIPIIGFTIFISVKIIVLQLCNLFVLVLYIICFILWGTDKVMWVANRSAWGKFHKTLLPFISILFFNFEFIFKKKDKNKWERLVGYCLEMSVIGSFYSRLEFNFKYLLDRGDLLETRRRNSVNEKILDSTLVFYKILWERFKLIPFLGTLTYRGIVLIEEFIFGARFYRRGFKTIPHNKRPGNRLCSEEICFRMTDRAIEEGPGGPLFKDYVSLVKSINTGSLSDKRLGFYYIFFFLSRIFPFRKPKEMFREAVKGLLLFKLMVISRHDQKVSFAEDITFFFYELRYICFGDNRGDRDSRLDKLYFVDKSGKGAEENFDYGLDKYFSQSGKYFAEGGFLSLLLQKFQPYSYDAFYGYVFKENLRRSMVDGLLDCIIDNRNSKDPTKGLIMTKEKVLAFNCVPLMMVFGVSAEEFFFQDSKVLYDRIVDMCRTMEKWGNRSNLGVKCYVQNYLGEYEEAGIMNKSYDLMFYDRSRREEVMGLYKYSGEYIISFKGRDKHQVDREYLKIIFIREVSPFTLEKVIKDGVALEYVVCCKKKFDKPAKTRPMGGRLVERYLDTSLFTLVRKKRARKKVGEIEKL